MVGFQANKIIAFLFIYFAIAWADINSQYRLGGDLLGCGKYLKTIELFLLSMDKELMSVELVCSVIFHESSFNERAVSKVGAIGLMQVRHIVVKELFMKTGLFFQDLFNPITNLTVGIWYLNRLMVYVPERCLKNANLTLHYILSAYNHGIGKVSRYEKCATRYSNMVLNKIREDKK